MIKDIILSIRKWNYVAEKDIKHIQDVCTSIKISNSFTQISAELTFEISYADYESLGIDIELGDLISLQYRNAYIFDGKVIDWNRKGKAKTMQIIAYDYCWWICKSNITRNFNNVSVLNALCSIYNEIDANYSIDKELGDNGNIMIGSHLVKDKPVSKALMAIYSEVTKATNGTYYYMHMDEYKCITITEADRYYSGLTIKPPSNKNYVDGNLIDYEINESMQNMITQVAIYNEDGSKTKVIENQSDSEEIWNVIELQEAQKSRWGTIQESITMDSNDTLPKVLDRANKLLSEKGVPSEELTVTCLGDINYKVAHGVMVKIPNEERYYDRFMYITSSEWEWNKDGSFISKLGLAPSKKHDLIEWEDIEEDQEDEGTNNSNETGSDLWNRIEKELRNYLGVPYVWGGKTPSGFDCSGYISYVYNQFSNELEIKNNKFSPPTTIMMNQGKDVTKDFPDNLKKGDVIFPHEGHVVAYLGDNKVIHSPKSGDVVKISDIYFNNVAKVIRVIPDSAWNTKSENSGSIESAGYSSQLVKFTESWEGYYDHWYTGDGTYTIGYGTSTAGNKGKLLRSQGITSCTPEQAEEWLKEELNVWAAEVKKYANKKGATLNQYSFDCMLDLCYQWGYTYLTGDKSNVFNALCSGNLETAKSGITGYPRRDSARKDILSGKYTLNN